MMGEGKRLEHNKRNAAEEKGKERRENKSNTLKKAGVMASGLLLTCALAKCGGNKSDTPADTSTDDGVTMQPCEPEEKARANLNVMPGMGYDTEDGEERRCNSEGGCLMGINEGEDIVIVNPEGVEEKWNVESIDEDMVVLKDSFSDRTIEVERGGSMYLDVEEGVSVFMEVQLVGSCLEGVCENGMATDIVNATGKAMVEVTVGGETKRILLADGESTALPIAGHTVDITLVKAVDGHVNVMVSSTSTDIKAELGDPVVEDTSLEVGDVSLKNQSSSDSATVECSRLTATLTITDEEIVDEETGEPIPYEREFEEGSKLMLGGQEFEVTSILAKIVEEGRDEVISNPKSYVKLTNITTAEEIVLRKGERLEVDEGKTIEVGTINVIVPDYY